MYSIFNGDDMTVLEKRLEALSRAKENTKSLERQLRDAKAHEYHCGIAVEVEKSCPTLCYNDKTGR